MANGTGDVPGLEMKLDQVRITLKFNFADFSGTTNFSTKFYRASDA
jgi:hypothetical protein